MKTKTFPRGIHPPGRKELAEDVPIEVLPTPATVAVPLLLGPQMGMDKGQVASLISAVMVCSGIATLLQVFLGTRLPIIQGVSFSFLAAFFAIISFGKAEGLSGGEIMQLIAGAVIVGSVIEMVVGFSGLIGLLRRFLKQPYQLC